MPTYGLASLFPTRRRSGRQPNASVPGRTTCECAACCGRCSTPPPTRRPAGGDPDLPCKLPKRLHRRHPRRTDTAAPTRTPEPQALVAAQVAAIAVAYTDSVEAGMRQLIDHVPATAPQPVPRPLFGEAVRLAQPNGDWAALRAVPTSTAVRRDAVLGQLHSDIRGRATVR
jgi:hypothetical protein